jgi:hypothetical protein
LFSAVNIQTLTYVYAFVVFLRKPIT